MAACSIRSRARHTPNYPKNGQSVYKLKEVSHIHTSLNVPYVHTFESWSGVWMDAQCWCRTLFKSSLVVIYLFHLAFNIRIAKFIRSILFPQLRIIIIPFWHILSRRVAAMRSGERSNQYYKRQREREREKCKINMVYRSVLSFRSHKKLLGCAKSNGWRESV